jgi:N-acetylmuramoyl-L-alanine amidase
MVWKEIVGKRFTGMEFETYVSQLVFGRWRPEFVVVHNTSVPSIEQRPHGFTEAHMQGLVKYYRDEQGWSGGPHAFVDQNGIWVFTPLTGSGVHSPSWNHNSWGIETLGDYATEAFEDPIKENLLGCLTALHQVMSLSPGSLKLHKEDQATTHKGCPGVNLRKDLLVAELTARLGDRRAPPEAVDLIAATERRNGPSGTVT